MHAGAHHAHTFVAASATLAHQAIIMVSDVRKATKLLDGLPSDAQLLWLVLNSSATEARPKLLSLPCWQFFFNLKNLACPRAFQSQRKGTVR